MPKILEFLRGLLPSKKEKPQETAKAELDVYVTPNGSKYHYDADCPSLRHARRIHKMSISKAKKARLTACDKCSYY